MSPVLDPEPPLSYTGVLPILDSIIERGEECALKLLISPKPWRHDQNPESDFHAFLIRYNELLCSRGNSCLKCNCNLPDGEDDQMMCSDGGDFYGTQKHTCYECMKQFCDKCKDDDVNYTNYYMDGLCKICERMYCIFCKKIAYCTLCDEVSCSEKCRNFVGCSQCSDITCSDCVSERKCPNNCGDNTWCNHCVENNYALRACEKCEVDYCEDCCNSDVYAVKHCHFCSEDLCGRCREQVCRARECVKCNEFVLALLFEENNRFQTEINEQSNEIKSLTCKVKELTAKLKEVDL
mmetsp:Transcript_14064/g.19977  ORF Transcript_14064/g.19977 Transcript_14064/m.19977 type:complete len:294 (-) Transcript_14064:51-932(-)